MEQAEKRTSETIQNSVPFSGNCQAQFPDDVLRGYTCPQPNDKLSILLTAVCFDVVDCRGRRKDRDNGEDKGSVNSGRETHYSGGEEART